MRLLFSVKIGFIVTLSLYMLYQNILNRNLKIDHFAWCMLFLPINIKIHSILRSFDINLYNSSFKKYLMVIKKELTGLTVTFPVVSSSPLAFLKWHLYEPMSLISQLQDNIYVFILRLSIELSKKSPTKNYPKYRLKIAQIIAEIARKISKKLR